MIKSCLSADCVIIDHNIIHHVIIIVTHVRNTALSLTVIWLCLCTKNKNSRTISEKELGINEKKTPSDVPDGPPASPEDPGRRWSRDRVAATRRASGRSCRWRCSRGAWGPWCPCSSGWPRAPGGSSRPRDCCARRPGASPSGPPSSCSRGGRRRSPGLLSPWTASSASSPASAAFLCVVWKNFFKFRTVRLKIFNLNFY